MTQFFSGFDRPNSDSLQLGILDLCKRSPGVSAAKSILNTLELAELAEKSGYTRYWVGEHHTPDTAQASPEIVIGWLAARTTRLKIGSGGVLLRYYSPLKVAENFRLLEAVFTGRIEAGVCKGPGVVSSQVALALASGNIIELSDEAYERKVQELARCLQGPAVSGEAVASHLPVYPLGFDSPPLWVLGGSPKTMKLAADCASPYAHTIFTNPKGPLPGDNLAVYYEQFAAKNPSLTPQSVLALSVVCLDSESQATRRHQQMLEAGCLKSNVVGNPGQCAEQLAELAHQYGTNQLLVTTWLGNGEERANLYGLLGEACQLAATPAMALN